jgi:hypothetical protein
MEADDGVNATYFRREFDIVKSSFVPRIRVPYTIGATGIEDAM